MEGDNREKKGQGQVKEYIPRTQGQGQWGGDCLWTQGLDGTGKSNGGGQGGEDSVNRATIKNRE